MSTLAYLTWNDFKLNNYFGKVQWKQITDFNNIFVSNNQSTEFDAMTDDEKIEKAMAEGQFIPPWEYTEKDKTKTDNRKGEGYFKLRKEVTKGHSTVIQSNKYFWVEELKNWCTYGYSSDVPAYDYETYFWECSIQYYSASESGEGTSVNAKFLIYHDEFGNFLPHADLVPYTTQQKILCELIRTQSLDYTNVAEDEYANLRAAAANNGIVINWIFSHAPAWNTKDYHRGDGQDEERLFQEMRGCCAVHGQDPIYKRNDRGYGAKVGMTHFQLYVWNGRNGFIPINEYNVSEREEIREWQKKIIDKNTTLVQHRGTLLNDTSYCTFAKDSECGSVISDFSIWYVGYNVKSSYPLQSPRKSNWYWEWNTGLKKFADYDTIADYKKAKTNSYFRDYLKTSPLQIIQGIFLSKERNYTIVDKQDFQCVRAAKPYFFNEKQIKYAGHTSNEPAIRQGMSVGNPAIWRCATGELLLCLKLYWGGTRDVCGLTNSDFLNEIMIEFFGDGRDKTIAKHWLHQTSNINTNEEKETPFNNIITADTFTLRPDCIQIPVKQAKDEKLNISLTVNDVNVSVEDIPEHVDYVAKW